MKTMKIFCAAAAVVLSAAAAGAQNMYDAINFSRNEYYGSARSMALGNAVTAVGGDLGTIGINPAGSAVANYGQLTITPGVSISAVGSAYSPYGETDYGPVRNYSRARMTLPNLGISAVFPTGRSRGLRSWTLAVVSNQTSQYNYYANAFDGSDISWDILTAYQAGMFGSYGNGADYVGVTEIIDPSGKWHYVPGPLSQNSVTHKWGSKNDVVMNLGLNFSDKVFVGFNLGLPYARYGYSEAFYESAVNPEQFPIVFMGDDGSEYDTNFLSASYGYQYLADVDGIYGKLGVIVTPFEGLRIGAAVQTPAMYTVTEHWQYSAATSFADDYFSDDKTSPEGEYSYNLTAPYSASFGLAWTFGTRGFVSLDYEFTDYSIMRFRELNPGRAVSQDIFFDLNEANRYFAGVAHNLRIGGEFRFTPAFSVRAGYSLATSPERHWTNDKGEDVTSGDFLAEFDVYNSRAKRLVSAEYYPDRTQAVSFGLGYSSPGSFFADIAAVLTSYPDSVFSPYYDYVNYDADGNEVNVASPRILNHRNLWNVALTIGWRF